MREAKPLHVTIASTLRIMSCRMSAKEYPVEEVQSQLRMIRLLCTMLEQSLLNPVERVELKEELKFIKVDETREKGAFLSATDSCERAKAVEETIYKDDYREQSRRILLSLYHRLFCNEE